MKIKQLEHHLQQIEGFQNPKILLEQYATSAHIASRMLYTMDQTFDDINGKIIGDFGCGCGVLAMGATLLSCDFCYGFDIDTDAINIAEENCEDLGVTNVDFIQCDLLDSNMLLSRFQKKKKVIDTVVMNPPFGTKHNKGMDIKFVEAASKIAKSSIYSLHKTSTREFMLKSAEKLDLKATVLAELKFDLPRTYRFHKKESVDVFVDLIRFEIL